MTDSNKDKTIAYDADIGKDHSNTKVSNMRISCLSSRPQHCQS